MIECEIRAFISEEEYHRLIDFFKKNAEYKGEDMQQTNYFDAQTKVRTQKNSKGTKIILKKGNVHEGAREEIEIECAGEDFDKINKIFIELGHPVVIEWYRKRHTFFWEGITVCIDDTEGYGYIIELEKLIDEYQKEQTLTELREKLNFLKIQETPKELFDKKFQHYKENWREMIDEH